VLERDSIPSPGGGEQWAREAAETNKKATSVFWLMVMDEDPMLVKVRFFPRS
jgi:hypothetical protein